jgi:hypothetical protein
MIGLPTGRRYAPICIGPQLERLLDLLQPVLDRTLFLFRWQLRERRFGVGLMELTVA